MFGFANALIRESISNGKLTHSLINLQSRTGVAEGGCEHIRYSLVFPEKRKKNDRKHYYQQVHRY